MLHTSRKIIGALSSAFDSETVIDGFQYDIGRDLTGYEDGTENPKGEKAVAAAIVQGQGDGLDRLAWHVRKQSPAERAEVVRDTLLRKATAKPQEMPSKGRPR